MAILKTAIFGAGGFAREILPFARLNKKLSVIRFVAVNSKVEKIDNIPVIEEKEFWLKFKRLGVKAVIVAVGEPAIRGKIFTAVKKAKLLLPAIIHPTAVLAEDCSCGDGTIIYPLVTVQVHGRVGEGVLLNAGCTLGHDAIIEDFVNINPGVNIAGNVRIRTFAYLGIGSSVVEKITIGENTTIGAGAVVIDDMPAHVISVGVPAKIIRNLKS